MNHDMRKSGSSPYLCTTALQKFWDPSAEEVLFLGEWCLRYDCRRDWQDLNYVILPHPWDDREAMHQAAAYEEEVYEELLEALADFLNQAHGEEHSRQYWRIIIGPWLLHFIQLLHERFLCLRQALDQYPGLRTAGLSPSSFRIPRHYWDHTWGSTGDPYNLQLYTALLLAMGVVIPVRPFQWALQLDFRKPAPFWKSVLKNLWRHLGPYWARQGTALMVDMYIPPRQLLNFMAQTGFKARWCSMPESEPWVNGAGPDDLHPRRRDLEALTLPQGDTFRSLIIKVLPAHFPLMYLEGYRACRGWVQENWKNEATQAVLTANALHGNEAFKFLAAELHERGAKLIAVQHGGAYGSARYNPVELLEREAADEFWSWGWEGNAVKPMANPKLSLLAAKRRNRQAAGQGYIFFAGNILPRYYYHNWSCPTGPQFGEYLDWQIGFLKALNPDVQARVIFRANPLDWGWCVRQRIQDACPEVRLDDPRNDFYDGLLGASLKVCDMNQTTLLESMAADIPTIAFWDPNRWELRPEAEPYFQQLRDAGILYDSPGEAAQAVNRLWPEVDDWWRQPEVQQARRNFADRYALQSPNWVRQWQECLRGMTRIEG